MEKMLSEQILSLSVLSSLETLAKPLFGECTMGRPAENVGPGRMLRVVHRTIKNGSVS